jgi:PhnB protein
MSFTPYIHFQGNCAEAMEAYARIFGATDLHMWRYKDAPPDAGMTPSDKVMHAAMTVGGQRLMASDFPPGMEGDPQKAVSVSHSVKDVDQGRKLFDQLAEGGAVAMPFGPTFFSKGFGMVRDRFGTHWMIMGPDADGA